MKQLQQLQHFTPKFQYFKGFLNSIEVSEFLNFKFRNSI